MKKIATLVSVIIVFALLLAACAKPTAAPEVPVVTEAPVATEAPVETEAPVATEAPAEGLTCAEPIKIGLITDLTGGLAIYGIMIPRSFMLGMEWATGAAGSAGDVFDIASMQENTFTVDNCEIIVYLRDDAGLPENTTTVANELIEVQKVNLLVDRKSVV